MKIPDIFACRPCLERLGWRKYVKMPRHFKLQVTDPDSVWRCTLCEKPVRVRVGG